MSDSETTNEDTVIMKSSNVENTFGQHVKKSRLERKENLRELFPTEDEINYRKNYKTLNIVKDMPELLKCTKCNISFEEDIVGGKKIYSHPLLKVLMCKDCCDFYGDGEFSMDEDGDDKYCRWCGEGGRLFICSKCVCGFCPNCIKHNFGKKCVNEIQKDDDWVCYFCNPMPLWKLRNVCELAEEESKANRLKTRKSVMLRESSRRSRLANQIKESAIDGENVDVDCVSNTKIESEPKIMPRRKRGRRPGKSAGVRDGISSSSLHSWEDDEPVTKQRKIVTYNKKVLGGTSSANEDGQKAAAFKKGSSSSSMEFSSSESHEEMEVKRGRGKRKRGPKLVKNKNAEKLKQILKVAEITSGLCCELCKKELRKLNKRNLSVPDEKLVSDCEKLKSMIILISSSLSTVHNMIISLQQKFSAEGLDIVFSRGDTSLLKTIAHLAGRGIRASSLATVVNNIVEIYPYTLVPSRTSASLFDNETKCNSYSDCAEDIRENGPIILKSNFDVVQTEENSRHTDDVESSGKLDSVPTKELCLTKVAPYGNVSCDSDKSTVIFETDGYFVSECDDDSLKNTYESGNIAMNSLQARKNSSDFDVDLTKMYENSLKLKEQLLKDSSDEISFSEMTDFSTSDNCRRRKIVRGEGLKETKRLKKKEMSREEREIAKLTNLKSLERRRQFHNSDVETSSYDTSDLQCTIERRSRRKETDKQASSSDNISLASATDNPPLDEVRLPVHRDENDFLNQCSLLLRDYVLKSTSSESEVEVPAENDSGNIKKRKLRRKKGKKALVDDGSDDDCRAVGKSSRKSSDSKWSEISMGEESTDSFDSLKLKKKRRYGSRKMNKKPLSTDSDFSEIIPLKTSRSPGKGRKIIRRIMKKGSLQVGTRNAIKMENERKKRVAERNECYEKFFPAMENSDRLVLDFNTETGEVLLEAPEVIVKHLKPHQKHGVKFMWDSCFESLTKLEEDNGSGCILAHCMGLGKTLQTITLVTTVMSHDLGLKTVLILCPLNVVNNWLDEFEFWLKDADLNINMYTLAKKDKAARDRYYAVKQWYANGGVLVLGYDMMRNLTNFGRKTRGQIESAANLCEFLLDPGPDLVICDEGHVLKNEDTSLSKCVREIKTARRIVLTGTPFQNNLLEYHSMVQFIKPNILGTKKEFVNRFENPIKNGQFEDSTAADVKLMRARSHVLHKLLDGCIQRFDYSVLMPFLPKKHEYVISIRLTETQAQLYQYYLDKCKKTPTQHKGSELFRDFTWLQKIWTHPRIVLSYMEEREQGNSQNESTDESVVCIEQDVSDEAYWKKVVKPEESEDIRSSGKLLFLFDVLTRCRKLGDKVLVFSHSLKNLTLIEDFLHKVNVANKGGENSEGIPSEYLDTWVEGVDYFRMDGSTGSDVRRKFCKWFNSEKKTRARLFLISTKAGGLGINLVGANRVVVFDASWNPSHDVQSIFRVYRFGQSKICYIYRLVAEATMEEKIYERQITKLSLEKRVLDEQQIERRYTMGNMQALYKYDPLPRDQWKVPMVPKDILLADILNVRKDLIVAYHEHDSLLENKEEEGMTEEERKAAWEDFEKERFMVENMLERVPFQRHTQSMDELTREVLRITGMYESSAPEPVPNFSPTAEHSSNKNPPFKVVNIYSMDKTLPPASTSGNATSEYFPPGSSV